VFLATISIGEGRSIKTYGQGEVLFAQGDPSDAVFYIQSGKLKVTVMSLQGKEAVVALPGEDEFIGESCLNGQRKRLSTATTMTECKIMRLEKDRILQVLRDEPAFSEMFISHILTRTARVEEDLVDQLFNSTEKRLARTLCALGLIDYNGHIEVHSSLLTVVLNEGPSGVRPPK
jgi:CRP/FNR family transcriptional regulator, cyclic AMP receptor protein